MSASPSHACNDELFGRFRVLQGGVTGCLAAHPRLIRTWLEGQPPREAEAGEGTGASRAWRTARLSSARRRELSELLGRTEVSSETEPLAHWLLTALPVCTYLEIAGVARPSLGALDAPADDCCRELTRLRDILFSANYGLAKAAARQRNRQAPADLLGAASCGLLDAIDRYVPDARAARFGYFANYWIRYHLSRYTQKCGSVVSFPINQHRIGHRIDRYLADRQSGGLPVPSDAEICAELKLGPDALYWHQLKPRMIALEGSHDREAPEPSLEYFICDPAPGPAAALEEREVGEQLRSLLRACAPPAIRVMLAHVRSVGSLAEAAGDYLAQLQELAADRARPWRRPMLNAVPVCGTPCGPVFRASRAAGGP